MNREELANKVRTGLIVTIGIIFTRDYYSLPL